MYVLNTICAFKNKQIINKHAAPPTPPICNKGWWACCHFRCLVVFSLGSLVVEKRLKIFSFSKQYIVFVKPFELVWNESFLRIKLTFVWWFGYIVEKDSVIHSSVCVSHLIVKGIKNTLYPLYCVSEKLEINGAWMFILHVWTSKAISFFTSILFGAFCSNQVS